MKKRTKKQVFEEIIDLRRENKLLKRDISYKYKRLNSNLKAIKENIEYLEVKNGNKL